MPATIAAEASSTRRQSTEDIFDPEPMLRDDMRDDMMDDIWI